MSVAVVEDVVVVAPVGRKAPDPELVAVGEGEVLRGTVLVRVVDDVIVERGAHELPVAHTLSVGQHPPPRFAGQLWKLDAHAEAVGDVEVEVEAVVTIMVLICVEEGSVKVIVSVITTVVTACDTPTNSVKIHNIKNLKTLTAHLSTSIIRYATTTTQLL